MKHLRHPCSCFFLIYFCVEGINCFATIIQETNPQNLLFNSTAEIQCKMKDHGLEQLTVFWFRQRYNSAEPDFVVSATDLEKATYGSSFRADQISVSRDTFRQMYFLTIKNLQLSNSGVYYCMVIKGSKMTLGNGAILNVVETLPTTVTPKPQTTVCKCRQVTPAKRRPTRGLSCSAVIWAPLAAFIAFLLIFLGYCIFHTHRIYKRSRLFFKKRLRH